MKRDSLELMRGAVRFPIGTDPDRDTQLAAAWRCKDVFDDSRPTQFGDDFDMNEFGSIKF
jgi:hypothetical protein